MKRFNTPKEKKINVYKIYTKDWYFNAGIIGFLNVISEGEKNIVNIEKKYNKNITIGENFIEFNKNLLKNFYDKYIEMLFCEYFDIENYKDRIIRLKLEIEKFNDTVKITEKILNSFALSGKIINRFIEIINNKESLIKVFKRNKNKRDILKKINKIESIINNFRSNFDVYRKIKKNNFILYYLDLEIQKKICAYNNTAEYIKHIVKKLDIADNNEKMCFICSLYSRKYEFNNAITQILGFNKDNSNWIWGFDSSKIAICPLCALIYACVPLGVVLIKRNISGENKNFLYVLNKNSNITNLYHSYWLFKESLKKEENQNKPFYVVLQEIIIKILKQKSEATLKNINFIEIIENKFGGQSTANYNIYNYNITKELAEFILLINEKIPQGYYKIDDNYYDITEEIIKKSLDYSLSFSDLSKYCQYYIRSFDSKSKIIVRFKISNIIHYIIKYINHIKGGDNNMQTEIVNKAFVNGKVLGQKIGQENKIKTLSYQLLNDLQISNRNGFMDKYLRTCMSYGVEIKLGSNNELVDIDNFLSFGYAFINGLLSCIKQNEKEVTK